MSKHTPGSWTVELHSSNPNKWNVVDEQGDMIAWYLPIDHATLIAAAPALLAECQSARAIFGAYLYAGYNSPGPTPENIDAAFWRLDALIAKIEGDAP